MKKILMLSIIALMTSAVYASYNEYETANIDTLKKQGYSESTLQIVDTARFYNQGQNGNYERRYKDQGKKTKYFYVKNYFDLIQDDAKFGEHEINFTNSWNGDETHYTRHKYYAGSNVEDL